MKIYFAGSIRGGREYVYLYHQMIEYMKKDHTVLTEHVGDLKLQESTNDKEIYAQDTAWLQESDIVIAECSSPSLGVGYELAYAEKYGKQIHIFYNENRTCLSAMLTGNEYFHLHPYRNENEIIPMLDRIFMIMRIEEMEKRMRRVIVWLKNYDSDISDDISILEEYYQGLWKSDYTADEAGEFPSDLPRGILSEDGLYNVLEEYEALKKHIR